jgi:ribosome-associated heat shock protein Hsp15
MPSPLERQRLDKWLWVARLFKTRALAAEAADRGRVEVNDLVAKPGRELKPGDRLTVRLDAGQPPRELVVRGLAPVRGPAPAAQALYDESERSRSAHAAWAERRRLAPEPAATRSDGRPTKRDRRELTASSERWQRWSASIDDK